MASSNDLNTVIMEALSRKPQRKQIAKAFDEVHRLNRDYLDRKRDTNGPVDKPYMPSYDKTTIKRRDDGTLSPAVTNNAQDPNRTSATRQTSTDETRQARHDSKHRQRRQRPKRAAVSVTPRVSARNSKITRYQYD